MPDYLARTKMSNFITDNELELPFMYFRAVAAAFNQSHIFKPSDSPMDIFTRLAIAWEDAIDEVLESDTLTYAEAFENWYQEYCSEAHISDKFTHIKIIDDDEDIQPEPHSIYLTLDKYKHSGRLVNANYQPELQKILAYANKALSQKALLSEIRALGSEVRAKENYELWLDVLYLADLNSGDDKHPDLMSILLDISQTNKACWTDFQNDECDDITIYTKLDNGDTVYDLSKYNKTAYKSGTDILRGNYDSGKKLIESILTTQKVQGRSSHNKKASK